MWFLVDNWVVCDELVSNWTLIVWKSILKLNYWTNFKKWVERPEISTKKSLNDAKIQKWRCENSKIVTIFFFEFWNAVKLYDLPR